MKRTSSSTSTATARQGVVAPFGESAPEAVVLLHRTAQARAAGPWPFDASAVLERAGACDGKRFVLGPDGSYDVQLNRFGRELDSWGVRSDNGHEGYMRDIMLYCRFLHESRGGKSIWQTDSADLRAYKLVRMRMDDENSISAATWRRSIAALDKWVEWSLYEELLDHEPFRYIDKTVMTPQGPKCVRVNAEYDVDDDQEPLHIVQFVDYLLWRNVGLRGELPDGRPDRSGVAGTVSAMRCSPTRSSTPACAWARGRVC
ncbi:site-specific integrase [Streptomyces sp. NPDC005236]|uniref:site-specific integrase n=1 Tax=Streptomyces sp. NPDC005236 TaxID=3157028 RepID=UPI0033B8BC89